jgi:hypothetical protein
MTWGSMSYCTMVFGPTNRPWSLKLLNSTFQIVDSANNVKFTSSTNNPQASGANLKLLDSGLLVLYDSNGLTLWASKGIISKTNIFISFF